MTKRDLFSLALKILGVVYVIAAIFSLVGFFGMIQIMFYPSSGGENPLGLAGLSLGTFIIILFLALILFKWGDRITARLVPVDSQLLESGAKEWEKPLFTLCLRVAGVFCLILVIPGIIYHPLHWISNMWNFGIHGERGDLNWAHFFTDIVVVLLGFYLLRGGKYVVRYVFREPKAKLIEGGPG